MYRIEFEPGDVGVFRSVEEVATAIKSGVITPRARIYHQASNKWLPIEFHPHYRMALDLVANGTASPTPSGPRPAIQLHREPAPVAIAVAAPEPVIPAPEPVMSAPELVIPEPEPAPEAHAEPEVEPEAEPALEAQAEPEPQAEAEPPEIFVPPRSREIRFIPVEDPAPRWQESRARVEAPRPRFEALMARFEEPAPLPLAPEPVIELEVPVASAAPLTGGAFYTPEESARPAFGPRFRLALAAKPGRPIALALAGAALIFSTHVGLSASAPWNLDLLGAGLTSLPFLHRDSGPSPAAKSIDAAPTTALTGPTGAARDPELQGSPSFGANSAFLTTSRGAAPAESKRLADRAPAAPAQLESAVETDPIVSAPSARDISVAAAKIPGLAPSVNGKITPAVLVTRYEAAYAAARTELETGIRTAGFGNVFAPEHLSTMQGIRSSRLSAGTASAYIARYHRREVEIEAAYADSAGEVVKSPGDRRVWDSRQVLQESPEAAKLAGFLLQEIDSVFGVLSSQADAYEIKDGSITFQDAAAAHAYAELRPWLDRQAHQWADTGSGPPTTAARVLRAIGTTRLPEGAAF